MKKKNSAGHGGPGEIILRKHVSSGTKIKQLLLNSKETMKSEKLK